MSLELFTKIMKHDRTSLRGAISFGKKAFYSSSWTTNDKKQNLYKAGSIVAHTWTNPQRTCVHFGKVNLYFETCDYGGMENLHAIVEQIVDELLFPVVVHKLLPGDFSLITKADVHAVYGAELKDVKEIMYLLFPEYYVRDSYVHEGECFLIMNEIRRPAFEW